jgi:CMP-N,N'-diacetyllegionaminic acid synthase
VSVLAVIPARGSSKGIPRKNLIPLAGRPLVEHTVAQALAARTVDRVVVSTDDDEIEAVARRLGAEVRRRPEELSGDTSLSESVLLDALDYLESEDSYRPDVLVFLQCTAPVRRAEDIDAAIKALSDAEADSLLSVVRVHRWLWRFAYGTPESVNYNYRQRPRRQDRPAEFLENGSIYVLKPWVLRECSNRLGGKIALYEMGYWSQFEIDEPDDVRLCEWILRERGDAG